MCQWFLLRVCNKPFDLTEVMANSFRPLHYYCRLTSIWVGIMLTEGYWWWAFKSISCVSFCCCSQLETFLLASESFQQALECCCFSLFAFSFSNNFLRRIWKYIQWKFHFPVETSLSYNKQIVQKRKFFNSHFRYFL